MPVLLKELPFTLILSSRIFRQRLGPREWLPTLAMTTGLAGLLFLLAPSAGGQPRLHWYGWLAGIGANLLLVAVLVLWARRGSLRHGDSGGSDRPDADTGSRALAGSLQAAVLAVAAGTTFGLTAALMKAMTGTFSSRGLGHLLTDWPLYAMVAYCSAAPRLWPNVMHRTIVRLSRPGCRLSFRGGLPHPPAGTGPGPWGAAAKITDRWPHSGVAGCPT